MTCITMMNDHTIVVMQIIKTFLFQFFCVFLLPLFNLFCFCQVHTISVLYCAHLCVKCSLVISNFLERSLDFPILLFSFISLHCLFKKAFLISPGYSLELCIQLGISFPFSFAFSSLLFSAICKATSNNHLPSCFSFSLGSFW